MASVLQQYRQLADITALQITSSYQSWTDFLTTAARLYKYPYHEQLMIYAQRPDATACADYELWNKRMGRYVRRGAKGIALIDHSGDAPKLKYVFDVADTRTTERSRSPYLWEYRLEHEQVVSSTLEEQYNVQYPGDFIDQLEQISSVKVAEYFLAHQQDILGIVDGSHLEGYHDLDKGVAFINAATVSTTYALLSRCGLVENAHFGTEDFMPVFDFNTPQTVYALGSAVSEIGEEVLRSIEVTIKKYEREKLSERSQENERTDLHTQRGLLDSQSEPVPAGEQAPGQVREDAESIPSGASPGAVEQPDPVGASVPPSAGDRRDGEQAVGADDAHTDAVGGGDGSSESQRPHEMGGADEQPESPGRGSDSDGADLRLTDEPPIQGEQFSFFPTEAQQIAYIAEAESAEIAPSAFSMPQEYIDQFLRYGSNTENHRTRIAIEYARQKPMDDLVDFLEKTYHGGCGLQFGTTKVCAWYAEDGMHIAYGSTARYARNAQILSWEDVAVRVGELLEQGQFATNVELAECRTFEKRQLAEQLWYMSHDISEKAIEAGHMSIVRSLRGGFPEETEKLMVFLSEPESYQAIMRQVYAFRDACNADKGMMRFQMYHPNKLIRLLEEYTLPRREYVSEMAELPAAKGFITEDEINEHLTGGSNFSGSKSRIYAFYQTPHTAKEKLDFLKNEYGIGGGNNALSHNFMSHVWTDGKGIRYDKPNCTRIELPWTKVVKYYDALIESGRFAPPEELEQRNDSEKVVDGELAEEQPETEEAEPIEATEPVQEEPDPAVWEYNEIKSAHPEDIVLYQVGDFFEIYGEDAKQAAPVLDLHLGTRPIPTGGRVDMCGIPAHQLEEATQKLRDRFHVTIAAVGEDGQRNSYSMRKLNPEPPRRELTQADIDEALQKWNGSIDSKHAVVRYMEAHSRERDTAAWLAREYGADPSQPLRITVTGVDGETVLPWPKVQRRIAQLIKAEKFFTQEEYDRFDDIDPAAIRERLPSPGGLPSSSIPRQISLLQALKPQTTGISLTWPWAMFPSGSTRSTTLPTTSWASRTHGIWCDSTIVRYLADERYTGTYIIGKRAVLEVGGNNSRFKDRSKWYIIPDHHPAIVDKSLFDKVQETVRRFSQPHRKQRDYLLKGIVFCGCCDHALSYVSNKRPYFVCRRSQAAENGPCHDLKVDALELEQAIFQTIKAQLEAVLSIRKDGSISLDTVVAERTEYEKQIEALEDSKQSLFEQYIMGEIDVGNYKSQKASYDAAILKAKNAHAAIAAQAKKKKEEQNRQSSRTEIAKAITDAEGLTPELVSLLIEKVYIFPDKRIEIAYKVNDLFD